jgi:hypothetical protein
MKVATYNVNGVNARLPVLLRWLADAVILNPAASVRAERYQAVVGKTPEITVEAARRLLASVGDRQVDGLRDRAVVGQAGAAPQPATRG